MKKYFYMAALLIVAALTTTSCGSDEPKEKTTATATYFMTFSPDLLNACEGLILYYKSDNGQNKFEPISSTTTTWTKTVTSDKFPAEFGVMYKFSTKSEAELTKDKYDLTCNLNFTVKTNNGDSHTNSITIIDSKGVAKDKVDDIIKKYDGKSTGFRVTKDGFVTPDNNLNYN